MLKLLDWLARFWRRLNKILAKEYFGRLRIVRKVNDLFKEDLNIVNVGLELFYRDLRNQERRVIQVDWRPLAGGDKKMVALLEKLQY